jgi:hypothetical protein
MIRLLWRTPATALFYKEGGKAGAMNEETSLKPVVRLKMITAFATVALYRIFLGHETDLTGKTRHRSFNACFWVVVKIKQEKFISLVEQ